MKLQELSEAVKFDHPFKLKHSAVELANVIKTHCRGALKAYKQSGKYLLRGLDLSDSEVNRIIKIRPDRKPVDVGKEFHDVLHELFLESGIRATRKNSIFCTTIINEAKNWGDAYIVFPKDGWIGSASKKNKRGLMFEDVYGLMRRIERDFDEPLRDEKIKNLIRTTMKTWKLYEVNPSNLATALKEQYEILISGDSYIAISLKKPEFIFELDEQLGLDMAGKLGLKRAAQK